MFHRSRRIQVFVRAGLACAVLLALSACMQTAPTEGAPPELAPQASGSFSGGSLGRGSVIGLFWGVGLGNTPHLVEFTTTGVQWFECRNKGGNLAPGQFAFTEGQTTSLDGLVDENGRFENLEIVEEGPQPTDDDCKRNWTVNRDAAGELVTFLQVRGVQADLFEVLGYDADGTPITEASPNDTILWTCEDPDPTNPLEAYAPPPLTGPGGVCTLVDGPNRG